MAKPRIFVSSTYYDLKHIRNNLEAFIETLGYETILFESGDIPFHHDAPLDISCYDEIKNAHMLVLIIGGRYGHNSSDDDTSVLEDELAFYNSITKKEYETAREKDIPIYIFIEKNVLSEFGTYKKNKDNITVEYAHVDNINIFKLIDEIYTQKRNNLVREFENFSDISFWLREQWAGLFADYLSKKSEKSKLSDLSSQINDLKGINSVLKDYSENILRAIQPDKSESIITKQDKILRKRTLNKFVDNNMIEYILEESKKKVNVELLLTNFYESNNLDEFVDISKIEDEIKKDLLGKFNNESVIEFKVLQDRLL